MATDLLTYGGTVTFNNNADQTLTNFALSDPDPAVSTASALTYDIDWNTNNTDDTLELLCRIMSGGTVLAASTSGGSFQVIFNVNSPATTTSTGSFNYVNTGATEAQWNAATIEYQQNWTKNMASDGCRIQITNSEFNLTYTPSAPTLTLPTETSITINSATVGCTTDIATGTMYWYVSTSATAPSATDLKNGTGAVDFGSQASPGVGTETFSVTGLSDNTNYYTYFIHTESVDSNLLESGVWTTLAIPTLTTQTTTSITDTTATVRCITDVSSASGGGTIYWYVSTSATPPSATDLKAGTGSVDFGSSTSFGTTVSGAATGLTEDTTYYNYWIQNNGADSNLLSNASFTTLVAPVLTVPTATSITDTTVTVGCTTDIAAGTVYTIISKSATPPDATIFYDSDLQRTGDAEGLCEPVKAVGSGDNIQAITFHPNGKFMYLMNFDELIKEYHLQTPWDVTTAVNQGVSAELDLGLHDGGVNLTGMFWKSDGTRVFFSSNTNNVIYEFDVSTAWKISTATWNGSGSNLTMPAGEQPQNCFFKPDGLELYMMVWDSPNYSVENYTLSTAWDVSTATSTASLDTNVGFLNVTNSPDAIFSPDGRFIYFCDDNIESIQLETPWDITSADTVQYDFNYTSTTRGVFNIDTAGQTITIGNNGKTLYYHGGATDTIYPFHFGRGWFEDFSRKPVTATGAQTLVFSGLEPNTTYYAHFLHRNGSLNSNVLTSTQWTTDEVDAASTTTTPSNLTVRTNQATVFAGTTFTMDFSASVSDDVMLAAISSAEDAVWVTGTSAPVAASAAMGTGVQSAGLFFGGDLDRNDQSALTLEYNGSTWGNFSLLLWPRSSGGGFGTQLSTICATGDDSEDGETDHFPVESEEYNGGTWSVEASILTARERGGSLGTQTAGLIVGGRTEDDTDLATTEEYNGVSWASGGLLASARDAGAGSGLQTEAIYSGGFTTVKITTVELYDGTAWSSGAALPFASSSHAGVGRNEQQLTYAAGANNDLAFQYNGSTWVSVDTMINQRYSRAHFGSQGAATAATGYLAVVAPTSNVEEYFNGEFFVPAEKDWEFVGYTSTVGANTGLWKKLADGTETNEAFGIKNAVPERLAKPIILLGTDNHQIDSISIKRINDNDDEPLSPPIDLPSTSNTVVVGFSTAGDQSPITAASGLTDIVNLGNASEYRSSTNPGAVGHYVGRQNNVADIPALAGTWSSLDDLLIGRRTHANFGDTTAGAVAANGTGTGSSQNYETYNGVSWSSGGNTNYNRAFVAGNGTETAGLVTGGNGSSQAESYNGTSWSTENDPINDLRDLGAAGTLSSAVIFAGYDTAHRPNTEEFNGTSFSAGGSLATGRAALGDAGTQTAALAINGSSGSGNRIDTEEYNGTSWSAGGDTSLANSALGGAGLQDAALSMGGYQGGVTNEKYDGTSWSSAGSMALSRGDTAGHGELGSGAGAFISGGFQSSQNRKEVEAYSASQGWLHGISTSSNWAGWTVYTSRSGDLEITTITEQLEITESDASVVKNVDTTVTTTTEAIEIATTTADVDINILRNVNATTEAIEVATTTATILTSRSVTGSTESITVTTSQAAVDRGLDVTTTTEAIEVSTTAADVDTNILFAVNATTEALSISETSATVFRGVNRTVAATTEVLQITENNATVDRGRGVSTTTESLTITETQAVVETGNNLEVDATTEAVLIASTQALVDSARDVTTTTEAIALGTNTAVVTRTIDRSFTTSTEALQIAESTATIVQGRVVTGSTESLLVTDNDATIQTDRAVAGATEALLVSDNEATVDLGRSFTTSTEALTISETSAVVSALVSQIVSVVPDSFADGTEAIVITTQAIDTTNAEVYIRGDLQTITGRTANTITITAVRGGQPLGATHVVVVP